MNVAGCRGLLELIFTQRATFENSEIEDLDIPIIKIVLLKIYSSLDVFIKAFIVFCQYTTG